MITSLFDWFHQPFIISLPKLFHQRRQHCVIGICKDKRPERHLPITHPVPMGRASQPLGTSRSRGQWGMSPCCQNQPCLHSKELHSLYMRCGCSNPAAQASPWRPPPRPQLPREGDAPTSPLPRLHSLAPPRQPPPTASQAGYRNTLLMAMPWSHREPGMSPSSKALPPGRRHPNIRSSTEGH